MFATSIDALTASDIDLLISSAVPEGRRIDYKRDLPGNGDDARREFLADVSSFANTEGGRIFYGLTEEAGLPVEVYGVGSEDMDAVKLRLSNMLNSNLAPKVDFRIESIACSEDRSVLVIEVRQGWMRPHRVTFKGDSRFYFRTAAGRNLMDIDDLRAAFLGSAGLTQRIQGFTEERLTAVVTNRAAFPLFSGPCLVLHLIPLSSFAGNEQVSVDRLLTLRARVRPLQAGSFDHRITLEGLMAFCPATAGEMGYTHLYRNGIVEAVDTYVMRRAVGGARGIPAVILDQMILVAVREYRDVLSGLGFAAPLFAHVALLGAKGLTLQRPRTAQTWDSPRPLDRDILTLPVATIPDLHSPVEQVMRPSIDAMWNAFGVAKSDDFDVEGNWTGSVHI